MAETAPKRPRIAGARQDEIFAAAIELLGEIGFDRLTLDAVANRARVSKASIYRLWGDKAALVDAAIECRPDADLSVPDTGSVLDDLAALVRMPGYFDVDRAAVISGLATAVHRDPQRHKDIREQIVEDGTKHVRYVLTRAIERGELDPGVDIELLSAVIPALVLFEMSYQTGGTFGSGLVADIVTKIITPVVQQHLVRLP